MEKDWKRVGTCSTSSIEIGKEGWKIVLEIDISPYNYTELARLALLGGKRITFSLPPAEDIAKANDMQITIHSLTP